MSAVPEPAQDANRHPPVSRRILVGGALGGGLLLLAAPSAGAAASSPIPKLPGEVSRTSAVTPRGVPYENITVNITGGNIPADKAQLFVPHTAIPAKSVVGVTWYYHANGSSYTAMNGAYKYSGELLVDQGAVTFCPNFGGSLWTTSAARAYHARAVVYLKSVFKIGMSFLRANSGGGSLMCWAYGQNLVPATKGMYMANGTYDMQDLYDRDPRVKAVYDSAGEQVSAANNPALLPGSAWTGKRIRVVVSDDAHPDVFVPPHQHGLALVASSTGFAIENSVVYHQEGHVVPSLANKDMVATFQRWSTA